MSARRKPTKRQAAARKGWETRRARQAERERAERLAQKKRQAAARKAAETRAKNERANRRLAGKFSRLAGGDVDTLAKRAGLPRRVVRAIVESRKIPKAVLDQVAGAVTRSDKAAKAAKAREQRKADRLAAARQANIDANIPAPVAETLARLRSPAGNTAEAREEWEEQLPDRGVRPEDTPREQAEEVLRRAGDVPPIEEARERTFGGELVRAVRTEQVPGEDGEGIFGTQAGRLLRAFCIWNVDNAMRTFRWMPWEHGAKVPKGPDHLDDQYESLQPSNILVIAMWQGAAGVLQ